MRHEKITEALAFMIVKANLPFCFIENEDFKVSPTYNIPSRQTITNIIDDKYDILKFAKAEKFKNTPVLSLTCDLWTETHNHT